MVYAQLTIGEVEIPQIVGCFDQSQLLLQIRTLVERVSLSVNDSFVEAMDHIIRIESTTPAAFHSLRRLEKVGGVSPDP